MSASPTASRADPSVVQGAGGVVFSGDGRVLLLAHADGAWVFPKGHIEAGESSRAAAVREVAEEAGIEASVMPGTPSWTTSYRNDRGVPRRITWFACETEDSDVTISESTFTTGGFFTPDDAMQRLTHRSDQELLAAVLDTVGNTDVGAT